MRICDRKHCVCEDARRLYGVGNQDMLLVCEIIMVRAIDRGGVAEDSHLRCEGIPTFLELLRG